MSNVGRDVEELPSDGADNTGMMNCMLSQIQNRCQTVRTKRFTERSQGRYKRPTSMGGLRIR